ncbi:LamG domain-containing protein [Caulobacter segnis]|uniref:LamG domain-containing protein n=1 Tax=Caulobacter segnis TaxID=88688 RepID=UPI00240F6790|nr:LamG domain-containing protein [Caulobacter segnis]MDG2521826.1 LamG domain-containing protein [Caulobacter segnis]
MTNVINRRDVLAGAAAVGLALPSVVAAKPAQRVWRFDNLKSVGGNALRIEGAPTLVAGPSGKAVKFDGVDDALFIGEHPLAGAKTFTFEAVFRPDGGAFEQRWFHLESDENPPVEPGRGTTRILFEIRVLEDRWYLDAFMRGPGYNKPMLVPEKLHPIGKWAHVAQTYDGAMYRSYVNGVLQMEAPVTFTPQGPGSASVGVRMNRVNYFNGAVHSARFTYAALQPSQFKGVIKR